MEKLIIFLPIILFFGFIGLLVVLFILFIVRGSYKAKTSEWRGIIIDKICNTQRKDKKRNYHFFTLVVKTDEGIVRKVAVTQEMYDSCEIGDRLEKPKGHFNPIKVEEKK